MIIDVGYFLSKTKTRPKTTFVSRGFTRFVSEILLVLWYGTALQHNLLMSIEFQEHPLLKSR